MTLLTTKEVAARLGNSVTWLEHARSDGTGPRYLKIGRNVRYRVEDVDRWLEEQARTRVWDFSNGEAA